MKELVEYIARSLVDHPDTVVVMESNEGGRMLLTLKVEAADMGRVIGKQGRIAQAMRTLLKVAAARADLPDRQPSLIISSLEEDGETTGPDGPSDAGTRAGEDEPAGT